MSSRSALHWLRRLDKRWQRNRRPAQRRILVDSRTAMNYATVAPVVEKLQADSRVEIFLTASESPELLPAIYAGANQPYQLITPRTATLMRFDAYLAADFLWAKLPRGTRRVQTFHGVAGKYRTVYDSPAASMRGWDRLFFINRRRLQNFIETGAIDPDSPSIRLIGMPKLDCLVDGSLKRDEILASLGIDPSAKTVLYAPTWSAYSSLSSMGEELVRRLGAAGYTVIVKLHDRSRQGDQYHSGGVAWGDRLLPLLKETGGMLATGSNSSTYLVAADVLITDHSSVGFEYLILDRPLIRIHLPELLDKTDIEPAYVQLLSQASYSIFNVDDVVRAVDESFANPSMKSCDRRSVAAEMFYEPGGATNRATSELYELIELDRAGD